jgi:hypothetical protein
VLLVGSSSQSLAKQTMFSPVMVRDSSPEGPEVDAFRTTQSGGEAEGSGHDHVRAGTVT